MATTNPTQELTQVRAEIKKIEGEIKMEEAKLKKLEDDARNVARHLEELKKTKTNNEQREKQLVTEIKTTLEKPAHH